MPTHYLKRAFEIFRKEGVVELFTKLVNFLNGKKNTIVSAPYTINRSIKYDAPPRTCYSISPKYINYSTGSNVKEYYGWSTRSPPFLILDGDWDKLKRKFENKKKYKAFVQKYEENKPLEETTYFNTLIDKGYNHREAIKEMRKYDRIFNDIRKNGYNRDKVTDPIKLYIGRNGEYMRATGQHRICIAKAINLESIPVQVELVHKHWQELREEIHNNGLPEEHEDLRNHPDLQDVIDE